MAKTKDRPLAAEQGASAPTRARVLTRIYVDGAPVEPDTVLELPAEQLRHYISTGEVDPHPDSVAYAEAQAKARAKAAQHGDVLEA